MLPELTPASGGGKTILRLMQDVVSRTELGLVAAVVPIKSFTTAKTRLGEKLDEGQRACLARVSAERVLKVVATHPKIAMRLAVVEDEEAADVARTAGFEVVLRPDLWGQSAAVDAGFELARHRGARTLLTISADVPLARPRDLDDLLHPESPILVMVSDREGKGTNALRLTPAIALRLHFGAGSLQAHMREAKDERIPVRVIDNRYLQLDLDTPADLDALEATPDGRRVLIEAGRLRREQIREDHWRPAGRPAGRLRQAAARLRPAKGRTR